MLGGKCLGNVRTDQIKRTAKELMRRFPEKFSNDFEANKHLVAVLTQGTTNHIRNQIAGYIARSLSGQTSETTEEEEAEQAEAAVGEES